MAADSLAPAVAALLALSGRGGGGFTIEPVTAGGNNRVYAVVSDDQRFAVKWYYHDASDPRDRLGAEYAFVRHAWMSGLRCIPEPLACDPAAHLALYEFVQGDKLTSDEIDTARVREAAAFFAALNSARSRAAAGALPNASEACFSVGEHVCIVDDRIARLAAIPGDEAIDADARGFVTELAGRWANTRQSILRACGEAEERLGAGERCLSPSDFGFHNALRRPDGSLCFIDFEYAGWDDPAKAVGDFFSHPGVPVPREHFDAFLDLACAALPHPRRAAARARLLEPVFRVKWCCIILNEFLPGAARRRQFADPAIDTGARKRAQLSKARVLLNSMSE
jgi:Phosphotransferase enzyme family